MFGNRSVFVVVPAFDEAPRIGATLRALPGFVDRVIVVDDGSTDGTADEVLACRDPRVELVRLDANRGVGHAVAAGYERALDGLADVTVVVGADGQMDPRDMPALVRTVIDGCDYAKGNRLRRLHGWFAMPPVRLAGTLTLSLFTMVATSRWHTFDSQCGYTAISRGALSRLPLRDLFPRYGYPNDLLVRLARIGAEVRDVPVRAIYGPETTKMRIPQVVGPLCGILWRGFVDRLRAA